MDLLVRGASFPSDRKTHTALPIFPTRSFLVIVKLTQHLLGQRTNASWKGQVPKVRFVAHSEAQKRKVQWQVKPT
jgi:hypothetical protein